MSNQKIAQFLGIDIGNTHTVVGLFQGRTIVHTWRIATKKDSTCHEVAPNVSFWLNQHEIKFSNISGVIVSSVVPPAAEIWWQFAQHYLKAPCLDAHSVAERIIQIDYPRPHEIGTDRLINSIGAFNRFKSACIVVDFGTATTFDCISKKGEYLGGAIAPGIGMSLQGLFSKTSRLPLVRLEDRDLPALGKTTEDAIRAGILYGFAGMTDRLLEELSGYFEDSSPVTVATGGLASVIFGVSKNLSELLPELTMEGLGICIEKSFLSK